MACLRVRPSAHESARRTHKRAREQSVSMPLSSFVSSFFFPPVMCIACLSFFCHLRDSFVSRLCFPVSPRCSTRASCKPSKIGGTTMCSCVCFLLFRGPACLVNSSPRVQVGAPVPITNAAYNLASKGLLGGRREGAGESKRGPRCCDFRIMAHRNSDSFAICFPSECA